MQRQRPLGEERAAPDCWFCALLRQSGLGFVPFAVSSERPRMRFTGHMVLPIKIAKTILASQGLAASWHPQGAVDQRIMIILAICGGRWQAGRRLRW